LWLGELVNLGGIAMEQGRFHSVELLEMALEAAARLGYRIREDSLGGFAGGACQLKGQKWLFFDPTLSSRERLQLVLDAFAADPDTATADLPPPLARVVKHRFAA
jgi:hypothetical protein